MRVKSVSYIVVCYFDAGTTEPVFFEELEDAQLYARERFNTEEYDYVFVWQEFEHYPEDGHGIRSGSVKYAYIKKPLFILLWDGRWIVDTQEALEFFGRSEIVRAIDAETLKTVL